jgi:hypothetical protein
LEDVVASDAFQASGAFFVSASPDASRSRRITGGQTLNHQFFTRDKLAEVLHLPGVSSDYWAKLAARGLGPRYLVVANRAYYDLDEARRWLHSRQVDPSRRTLPAEAPGATASIPAPAAQPAPAAVPPRPNRPVAPATPDRRRHHDQASRHPLTLLISNGGDIAAEIPTTSTAMWTHYHRIIGMVRHLDDATIHDRTGREIDAALSNRAWSELLVVGGVSLLALSDIMISAMLAGDAPVEILCETVRDADGQFRVGLVVNNLKSLGFSLSAANDNTDQG